MSCGSRGPVAVQSLCATAFYHSGRAEVRWSQVTIVLFVLVCFSCPIVTCGKRLQEPKPIVLPPLGLSSDSRHLHDARKERQRAVMFAMNELWLKPFIIKSYWLGHGISLCISKPPLLCFLAQGNRTTAERAKL